MEALLRDGSASRAGLSRTTGLSKQTMSEVIRVLTERGWVRESGMISGGVGRSAVRYEIDSRAGFVLGIDLGASTIRGVMADITGAIVTETEIAADPRGGAHLPAQIAQLKADILQAAEMTSDKLLLATVAIPGVMNQQSGHLDLAPNLAGIGDMDVATTLRQALDCKVIFENDVNAAALGEYWETGEYVEGHFAFVSLGTGVGLGILVDGKLLRGASLAAGEIGYLPLGADPFMPLSLERGALECAIGAAGISARYQMAGGTGVLSVREIFDRYRAGERAAIATIEETARLAALVVVTVTAVIDPDKVVFGGNIGARPELVEIISRILPTATRRPVKVEASRLGARATVVGAAAIALGELHNSLFSPRELPNKLDLPTLRR